MLPRHTRRLDALVALLLGGAGIPKTTPIKVVTGPATVAALPGFVYSCDVTAGNVVIDVPVLTVGQQIGVIAAAGGVNGAAYATQSITINASGGQLLALPAPGNLSAPLASYVIGGPGSTSGGGVLDAGTSITWVNGGVPANVLSLL